MDNNVLTLEQIQKMSIDEITDAYRNGYVLSERSEALQIYSTANTPQIYYAASNGSHYTTSDIGVIAVAIGISVGLLGLLTWYIIRKEEDRIMSQIKEAVKSATSKVGLIEKLIPLAERIGERILPPKA